MCSDIIILEKCTNVGRAFFDYNEIIFNIAFQMLFIRQKVRVFFKYGLCVVKIRIAFYNEILILPDAVSLPEIGIHPADNVFCVNVETTN